ncbi:MFS transporter [Devosia sp. SL43]|uniref:MFS transporter n=1 Tax=Devosia sp. SL43 TaxID=2806348 RepID=UPI001F3C4B1E|nr:MFS transporter [Devosia sp. SL43]UJW86234.1 MFS transporter [Devosia sp. SL43]
MSNPSGSKSPYLLLSALLVSEALFVTGYGLQLMLLPIRGGMEGFSAVDLGLLGSSYYLGFVAGCLLTPVLLSRVGHTRTFAALVSITAAVSICYPMLAQPQFWALLRFITGICLAGLYLIIESWINDRATSSTRGTMISIYVALNYIATAVGQMMITLYDASSFMLFSVASIVISSAVVPLALSQSPAPQPPSLVRLRPLHLFKLSPAGTTAIFLTGMAIGALWSLGPVFALSKTGDLASAAQFMSAVVIGGALAQWPLGKLSDHFDRRHVLIGITLAATVASVTVALLPQLSGGWLIFAALFGATVLPSYAVASAHVFDVADRSEYVQVSGGLLLLYGVGSAMGPMLAAVAIQWFGLAALAAFVAVVQLAIVTFVVVRMRLNKLQVVTDKQAFDMTTAAPVVPAGFGAPSSGERFDARADD